jgi:hypothetical protein
MKKRPNNTDNATLLKVISEQQQTIKSLHQELEQLQHKLDKLLHLLYGTKSEKKSTSPTPRHQLLIGWCLLRKKKKPILIPSTWMAGAPCLLIYLEFELNMMFLKIKEIVLVAL